ncbi:DNA topoisomerase 3-alpha [Symbiodinium microadriaticum]|uniref:DNA topoisomerase 3-alpha n=1 Tax=Symbiodinium microadriaticum TaxID=2951 RepID=A0A1Q9CV99_SYMMI|nr:DNA topoisomerase 3-alpha [Symbiodinium microadriaticum]
MLDMKGSHKAPMKFGGKGTKVHVDLLKLRTKCARCGTVGHWARECRNPPDERGRQSLARSSSTGPSSVSSPSTRSGFYVETSPPEAVKPSMTGFQENKTFTYMSYVPTFGSIMSSVLGRQKTVKPESDNELCDSFVGVTTVSGEGIVDTAAQDGLIGKAALLQLTETLRGFGLQIRWNHAKKAQASGVGGKAKVLGIAELPIGLAGINGLLEVTVVQDNVPLLLPIKLLRQLRAVVDLDANLLRLKAYGVETSMHEMPSGHMSVSVTSYAPEGWSLPHAAQTQSLKPEQYVLVTSGFLNQSMYPLESSSPKSVKFDIGDLYGEPATAPDDGSTGEGCADASRETGTVSSPKPPGSKEVEICSRENGRPDDACAASRKGYRMAARWLVAAVGAGSIASSGERFSYYSPGAFLNLHCDREAAGVCQGDPGGPGAGNQYSKEVWCNLCKARWEYLTPEKLANLEMEKNKMEEIASSKPMSSGQEVILCTCRKEAVKMTVKKAGPTQGRHFYKCRQRVCEFFLWDPAEQEQIRRSEGAMDTEVEDPVKVQMEAMMNAQAIAHQREVDELRTQLAWMQGFAQQWQMSQMAQNGESGSMDGFQMVQGPQ